MPGAVLTIGNFDGVHAGHAALIARAWEIASARGARVVALSFDPHPASVLRPGSEPARLMVWAERERLLRQAGADEVVRLEPRPELLGMSPDSFVASLVAEWSPVAFVEGPDFRFGKGRAGDLCLLETMGRAHGFEVVTVETVEVSLGDHTIAPASSTLVRWLLGNGRVGDAARVLGRDYELAGEVVPGDRRGREIGFPTANVRTECLAPADGVYAGVGVLPDGAELPGAISIGTKPTFGDHARAVEAFLLTCGPGRPRPGADHGWTRLRELPEYGWRLRLRFGAWVRDMVKFDSLSDLLSQMNRDCERVREWSAGRGSGAREGTEEAACR